MKRVLRWHDFGTGREASRSEYRGGCDSLAAGSLAGAAAQAPQPLWSDTPLCAPSRTTLRETEAGAHSQGKRQSHVPKLAPALWVAAKTDAGFVGRLGHIRDMACVVLLAIARFGQQRTRASLC